MFNYRLTRLPFAALMYGHAFWEAHQLAGYETRGIVLVLCSLPFLLIFVIWPRLRDCDWPLWFGYLLAIPFLGDLLAISLLWTPSKVLGRKEHAPELPLATVPKQIAGSVCAKCGDKIIMASEGAVQDGQILCNSCHTPGAASAGP